MVCRTNGQNIIFKNHGLNHPTKVLGEMLRLLIFRIIVTQLACRVKLKATLIRKARNGRKRQSGRIVSGIGKVTPYKIWHPVK